jgi:2'-5' RNA ligase
MFRLFTAIAVPGEIGQVLARCQRGVAGARWSPVENLHITLRFFGGVSEDRADDLDAELGAIRSKAFDLALAGVGVFESAGGPRTVWAGVANCPPLGALAARCETAGRRAGLAADSRAFRPHVTLAYLSGADPARVAAWVQSHNLLKSPPFHVGAFGLYSSWRTDAGQVYRLERRYSLA